MMQATVFIGNAVGPTIGGTLAMKMGLRIPFLATAAAQLLLIVLILLTPRKRRQPTSGSEIIQDA